MLLSKWKGWSATQRNMIKMLWMRSSQSVARLRVVSTHPSISIPTCSRWRGKGRQSTWQRRSSSSNVSRPDLAGRQPILGRPTRDSQPRLLQGVSHRTHQQHQSNRTRHHVLLVNRASETPAHLLHTAWHQLSPCLAHDMGLSIVRLAAARLRPASSRPGLRSCNADMSRSPLFVANLSALAISHSINCPSAPVP